MVVGIARWSRHWVDAGVRYIIPVLFLFLSLYNMCIMLIGMHHLHFAMEIELLSRDEQLSFVGIRPDGVVDEERTNWSLRRSCCKIMNTFELRGGRWWFGLVGILWTISPIALMVGSVLLTWICTYAIFRFRPAYKNVEPKTK